MRDCALAIDIGASSGRHIVGRLQDGRITLDEVYRFDNAMVNRDGQLCWDTEALFRHLVDGLKQCRLKGYEPATLGIDTWGVDYVLIDNEGQSVGHAVAYRDERTKGQDARFEHTMSDRERYERTGIAKASYNTLYQLMADLAHDPEHRVRAKRLLFMPSYLSYLLTGVAQNEYTIASTSSLLHCDSRDWDDQVLAAAGIPAALLGDKPVPAGTVLGPLKPEIAREVGFDCRVILPACHDTASAYLAMPVFDDRTARLSSGTWSLLGIKRDKGLLTDAARLSGFTNEGCHDGDIRVLKNLTGMWILQSLKKEWQDALSHADICQLAKEGSAYRAVFDPADERFLAPVSMEQAVLEALAETGTKPPRNRAELLFSIHHSLAACYQRAIREMETLTGTPLSRINIVGGGSQNTLVNQLTADLTGLPVTAGPVECSALGNVLCQLMKTHPHLNPAQVVADSFELIHITPGATA